MGRIGKQPIIIPQGVTLTFADREVTVSGPKGTLKFTIRPEIKLTQSDGVVTLSPISDSRLTRQLHGVTRSLIANMVIGVTDGWSKTLEISGTGYRAAVTGNDLTLNLGFSHPVIVKAPQNIAFQVQENKIVVSGPDKILVGEITAKIRGIKPPDPYKAKGIKYLGEHIRRKAGKAAKAGAATTSGTK